ncbi:cytochrome c [uncultured Aquimarina sp.]|uniref:cytochrome c n=1 Tax=uncultured Aquimarina sp. TaxID=575652 RepID=UPI0026298AAF|nr:cytochrome c [uncultured Aquimarina sp.]
MKSFSKIKLICLLAVSIFYSCETNVEEETVAIEVCDDEISFSSDIKPIINNDCIRCHGGSGNQAPDLTTFENISNNANRVRREVVNRTMPLGGSLSNNEIELIRCWIDNGALNN